jgi:UDP-N-acetylglucosamine transferase subunit ALG13
MIFVTVGASQFPFDRLLRGLGDIGREEEVVVQHGPSLVRPAGARCVAFLSFGEVAAHARRARAVVSHGGIGSVFVALGEGKRPLVVPRLARFGETVDDHQLDSVRRLERAGLVTAVLDPDHLSRVLRAGSGSNWTPPEGDGRLLGELRDYIEASVGHPVAGAAP